MIDQLQWCGIEDGSSRFVDHGAKVLLLENDDAVSKAFDQLLALL